MAWSSFPQPLNESQATRHPRMLLAGVQGFKTSGFPPEACGNDVRVVGADICFLPDALYPVYPRQGWDSAPGRIIVAVGRIPSPGQVFSTDGSPDAALSDRVFDLALRCHKSPNLWYSKPGESLGGSSSILTLVCRVSLNDFKLKRGLWEVCRKPPSDSFGR